MDNSTPTFLPNYTICDPILVDSLENNIEKDDIYYSLCELMSVIDITPMFKDGVLNEICGPGRKPYDPKKLLFAIILAYAENRRSIREMEKFMKYDIRIHFLLKLKTPNHSTICDFINNCLVDGIDSIFDAIVEAIQILDGEHLDNETVYIDGTKIEASSNKYTFVWKKASMRSRDKMQDKITDQIVELNDLYFDKHQVTVETKDLYDPVDLMDIIKLIEYVMQEENVQMIETGRGKRTPKLQKFHIIFTEFLNRTKNYIKNIEICGEARNSYSKTDLDATFLRMKTDYMGNTALLPAYNLQLLTSGRYIVLAECYQYGSDNTCFIPIIEKFNERYHHYPMKIVGDAGYGVLTNYEYCEVNDIEAFLKYSRFQQDCHPNKKQKEKSKFMIKNFKKKDGKVYCPGGKELTLVRRDRIDGLDEDRVIESYRCDSCEGCPLRGTCTKNKDATCRTFDLNTYREEHYDKAREMLQSEEGHQLRANRAAIAEGAFGDIKGNFGFTRFSRKTLKKVNYEAKMVAIGHNIRAFNNIRSQRLKEQGLI